MSIVKCFPSSAKSTRRPRRRRPQGQPRSPGSSGPRSPPTTTSARTSVTSSPGTATPQSEEGTDRTMWNRPAPNALDPRRTALVVFDMLETYRPEIEASGAIPKAQQLIQLCRDNGILICFARADHRPDGKDFTRVIADVDRWFDPWTDKKPHRSRRATRLPTTGRWRSWASSPRTSTSPSTAGALSTGLRSTSP